MTLESVIKVDNVVSELKDGETVVEVDIPCPWGRREVWPHVPSLSPLQRR